MKFNKVLIKLAVLFIILFWPFSLYTVNTPTDFLKYLLPILLVASSFYFSVKDKNALSFLSLLTIPFFSVKLAILPLTYVVLESILSKKIEFLKLTASIIVLIIFWNQFSGHTVFQTDYQKRQQVIRNTLLYPNIFTARLFHNKARIFTDKLIDNFFVLSDPNNYFFGNHPREIIPENQNLVKFPFLSLPFLLLSLIYHEKLKHKKAIMTLIISCIITLTLLTNFDRYDLILWPPIAYLIFSGVVIFEKKYSWSKYYFLIFSILAIVESIHFIIGKSL